VCAFTVSEQVSRGLRLGGLGGMGGMGGMGVEEILDKPSPAGAGDSPCLQWLPPCPDHSSIRPVYDSIVAVLHTSISAIVDGEQPAQAVFD